MSGLGNIIKKEVRELLTPATFLPIIIVALIFGTLGNSIQGIQQQALVAPTIGVINEANTTFSQIATEVLYHNAKVVFNSTSLSDRAAGIQTVKEKKGIALFIIPANFTERILSGKPGNLEVDWIMKGTGVFDSISTSIAQYLITTINTNISKDLIKHNTTVNASIVLAPTQRNETTFFKDRVFVGLSPDAITGMLSQQSFLIPLVMMMIIIMAGSIVITSMALEKENKTLETLLTLPVKRTSIVTGKIVAAALIGLLLAVIYMIGMGYYISGLGVTAGVNLAVYGLVLTSQDFLLIGISLFVTLIAGLALCMLLGTFAKNYKSAQTLTFPITMLALIPMFLTIFTDFDTLPLGLQIITFAIPFAHPMLAPKALLFHDYTLVLAGILYVLVFAIITISIVVWVFKTDRLLTGSTRKFKLGKYSVFRRRR